MWTEYGGGGGGGGGGGEGERHLQLDVSPLLSMQPHTATKNRLCDFWDQEEDKAEDTTEATEATEAAKATEATEPTEAKSVTSVKAATEPIDQIGATVQTEAFNTVTVNTPHPTPTPHPPAPTPPPPSSPSSPSSPPPTVTTSQGVAVGVYAAKGVERYGGIPFASPPLGSLRLRRARLSSGRWAGGTLNASIMGAPCLQNPLGTLN